LIAYQRAPDVEELANKIIGALALRHIDRSRLHYYRSTGSKSQRVQARIHGMGKIWFDALAIKPHYIIEVISEEYDRLAEQERQKVVIHELMHIPSKFSGGFVPHRGKVNRRNVDRLYREFVEKSTSGQEAFF
jgi:predicted metallopeptidase